jgi:DNA polymerase-3 subunit delta'
MDESTVMTDYFAQVKGQETAVRLLRQTLEQEKLHHAYLFFGPPGVGKAAAAEALIRTVFSLPAFTLGEPLPDVCVLALQEDEKTIGKNAVSKELIPWLGLKPYRQARKIAVIANAQTMTPEAANALLKILEEPPSYATIILLADHIQLLPTIMSRCQQVRFAALAHEQVAELLMDMGMEPGEAKKRAALSQGSLGLARSLDGETMEATWNAAVLLLQSFHRGDRAAIFSAGAQLEKDPLLASALLALLRDLRVYQAAEDERLLLLPELTIGKLQRIGVTERFFAAWQNVQQLGRYRSGSVNKLMLGVNAGWQLYHMLARQR